MTRGLCIGVAGQPKKTKYIYADVPKVGTKKIKKGYVGTKDGVKMFYLSSVTYSFIDNISDKREIREVETKDADIVNGHYEIKSRSYVGNISSLYDGYIKYDISAILPSFALEPKFQYHLYGFSAKGQGRTVFVTANEGQLKLYNHYTSDVTPILPIPPNTKYIYIYARNSQPLDITESKTDKISVDDFVLTYEAEDWVTKIDNYDDKREIVGVKNGYGQCYEFKDSLEFGPYSNSESNESNIVRYVYDASKIHTGIVKEVEINTRIKSMSATNDGLPKVYIGIDYVGGGNYSSPILTYAQDVRVRVSIPAGKTIKEISINTYVMKADFYQGSTANIKIETFRYSYLQ